MGLFDKVKEIVLGTDVESDEQETVEETEQPVREKVTEEPIYNTKREAPAKLIKSKSSNYTGGTGMQVILEKPTRYEEVVGIADKLNTGKAIIINLEETPIDIQRRIVDFLCGAAYAHGGAMKKAAKNIFVVAARDVDVAGALLGDDFDDDRIYF